MVTFAESGFIKMKKIVTFMFLAVMMALFVESCGAEMRIQGAHVYGENEIDGRWILYDFDVPKEVETVKQYKTVIKDNKKEMLHNKHLFDYRIHITYGAE